MKNNFKQLSVLLILFLMVTLAATSKEELGLEQMLFGGLSNGVGSSKIK